MYPANQNKVWPVMFNNTAGNKAMNRITAKTLNIMANMMTTLKYRCMNGSGGKKTYRYRRRLYIRNTIPPAGPEMCIPDRGLISE
jgi:hypothetical protein